MMKGLLIGGAVALCIYIVYRSYYMLNLDGDLGRRIREGAVILDVRTQREWDAGHIVGAVHIPLGKLRTGPIPLDAARPIITCCSHGLRSVKAVSILKARGYHNVWNGGAWSDLEQLQLRTPRR